MDEGRTGLLLQAQRLLIGIVIRALGQNNLRTQTLCRLHLADGSAVRHADDAADPLMGRRQGNALGVVPGAAGDDAGGLLLLRQLADLIIRTPQLEAAGDLKVFRL